MNSFNIAMTRFRVDTTFVSFSQVVANVQETGSRECLSEAVLGVGCHKTGKPIIRDTDRWYDFSRTQVLKTRLTEDR